MNKFAIRPRNFSGLGNFWPGQGQPARPRPACQAKASLPGQGQPARPRPACLAKANLPGPPFGPGQPSDDFWSHRTSLWSHRTWSGVKDHASGATDRIILDTVYDPASELRNFGRSGRACLLSSLPGQGQPAGPRPA